MVDEIKPHRKLANILLGKGKREENPPSEIPAGTSGALLPAGTPAEIKPRRKLANILLGKGKREENPPSEIPVSKRRAGRPSGLPVGQGGSFLAEETRSMDRERRLKEQQGHRQRAKVHAREHREEQQQQSAPEGELQNNILQNPWLDSQRFDGVDPNLNPEPPLNTEARREFDNERREQEQEKQLRLGNLPRMSKAPKPPGA